MKRFVMAMNALVLVLVAAADLEAGQIVLNFDELPGMNYISGNPIPQSSQLSDHYLSTYGILFSSGNPYVAVVDLGTSQTTSGTNGIGGSTPLGILTYDRNFQVVAEFFNPSDTSKLAITDFVSVRGDLVGSGLPITLDAFDINGKLIDSFTTNDTGGVTLTVSAPDIHSVQFLGTMDQDGVALDDFTFNSVGPLSAVPEPASVVLVGIGAIALAYAGQLRKKAGPEAIGPSCEL
jgi:hypothetical protein